MDFRVWIYKLRFIWYFYGHRTLPSLSAFTMYLTGISAVWQGLRNLLSPRRTLSAKNLPPSALPSLNAYSVVLTGLGSSCVLAAYQENTAMFVLSLLRLPAALICGAQGYAWSKLAAWQAVSAGLTALALIFDTVRAWRAKQAMVSARAFGLYMA